jgi:hypothetical protein
VLSGSRVSGALKLGSKAGACEELGADRVIRVDVEDDLSDVGSAKLA